MACKFKLRLTGLFTRTSKFRLGSMLTVTNEKNFSTELSYKILESTSSQPPILMAHGLMGNKNNFNSVARKLNEDTGRMIITYDAVNHGKSKHSDQMSTASMSYDVIELLDTLNLRQCTFIGHSMGGKVAMHTALAHPDRIEKLVVVDTSPSNLTSKRMAQNTTQYVKAMKQVVWSKDSSLASARLRADMQLLDNHIRNDSLRAFLVTNVCELKPGKYGWRVNLDAIEQHLENPLKFSTTLPPFTNSTLFLGGGDSEYITSDDYPTIKHFFPNSIISHIPNCGHWVHSDRPNEFISIITAFLQPQTTSLF